VLLVPTQLNKTKKLLWCQATKSSNNMYKFNSQVHNSETKIHFNSGLAMTMPIIAMAQTGRARLLSNKLFLITTRLLMLQLPRINSCQHVQNTVMKSPQDYQYLDGCNNDHVSNKELQPFDNRTLQFPWVGNYSSCCERRFIIILTGEIL
jgi:hypothetical protein